MKLFFAILFLFVLTHCQNPVKSTETSDEVPVSKATSNNQSSKIPSFSHPYDLDAPTSSFKLPRKLTEISGLSMSNDDQSLLAVNDEQGLVFFIDKHSGEITGDQKFHKSGDYEGVEMVGDTIYVVKNNGTLYQIKGIGKQEAETQVFKTKLKTSNNIEGLGYDSKNHRLLLSCKGKPGIEKKLAHQKTFYAFDLASKTLDLDPAFAINRKTVKQYVQKHSDRTEKFLEIFAPDQAADAIGPSGIAIHPLTNHIYVISSIGKLFLILDASGGILHIEKLDKNIHKQPEGICFDKAGNLYISSEGRGGKGRIYHFAMN